MPKKQRIVLGEGYPWFAGGMKSVMLTDEQNGSANVVRLNSPIGGWLKCRLILEPVVEAKRKKKRS